MGAAAVKLRAVWLTSAVNEKGEYVPQKGLWADTSKERAQHRVAALNLPGCWLRDAGLTASLVGRCEIPRTTSPLPHE